MHFIDENENENENNDNENLFEDEGIQDGPTIGDVLEGEGLILETGTGNKWKYSIMHYISFILYEFFFSFLMSLK